MPDIDEKKVHHLMWTAVPANAKSIKTGESAVSRYSSSIKQHLLQQQFILREPPDTNHLPGTEEKCVVVSVAH